MMQGKLQVPNLDLDSAIHYKTEASKGLLAPVASLLEGPLSRQALQVKHPVKQGQSRVLLKNL